LGNQTLANLASAPRLLLVTGHPESPQPTANAVSGGATGDSGGTITETIASPATPTPAPSAGAAPAALAPLPAGSYGAPTLTPTGGGGGGNGGASNLLNLPPIKHVFFIVLSGQGYSRTFAPGSADPYLSRTLATKGEVVSNYYSVAPSSLANGVALISGQGPTQETEADCPTFSAITPATLGKEEQILGHGCAYPQKAGTLPGQLVSNGFAWKAYIDGLTTARNPAKDCWRPKQGASDPDHSPDALHPYVTPRNPFVYFDGLSAIQGCQANAADMAALTKDLATVATTPSLSYIVPSRCEDGSEDPCAPGAPAGLTPADAFLRRVVPQIESSPAYKADGLIAVTFDQAPQSGPNTDQSACCSTPPYPNGPPPSSTGATTTTQTTTSTPGSATAPGNAVSTPAGTGSTPTVTVSAPTGTIPTGPSSTASTPGATATTPVVSGATPGATTSTPGTTTTTTTRTTGPPGANTGQTTPTGGGGQVGLLLLSQYVKADSIDRVDYYNHYSLLATVENLFSLPRLGFTGDPNLPVFDAVIFNAHKHG